MAAETTRIGCFVRDAKPMEGVGPRPIGSDGSTQDNNRRLRADIAHVAAKTRDPIDWAGISYYLYRREVQTDEAYMYYGQPGLAVARAAFDGVEERAALDRVRNVTAAVPVPDDVDIVTRAKLAALLRDPDRFGPCRRTATR